MITQDYLKSIINYNPETGVFTWKKRMSQNVKAGDVAGTNCDGYVKIRINSKGYRAHRLAFLYMTGEMPEQVDHIKGIKSDNRWEKIREATHSVNMRNKCINKNNQSGVCGVRFEEDRNKWAANIGANGKQKKIGRYGDKFEAICARKSAENKHGYHENHGRPAAGEVSWG